METVVSLIPNDEHVAKAKQELEKAGFAKSKISVLFQPADVWQRLGGRQRFRTVIKDAVIGALFGLVIGAIYGIPTGIILCRFMNCPLQTGVVLWVIVTLFWVIAAGILGAIIGLNKLEDDLYSYVEGVRRGEALLIIETPIERASEALGILRHEHGTVIHEIHEEI